MATTKAALVSVPASVSPAIASGDTAPAAAANRILTSKPSSRGLQLRKAQKISVEQERDLREQLHQEIEQKAKACSYFVYECSLPRIDGFEFCLRHILQDPSAPYKQCSYVYQRINKRCPQPAPKRDATTSLCFQHSRQAQLQLTRSKFGTYRAVETNETLLRDLAHRVDAERGRQARQQQPKYVDAFGPSARVLNYASDDSDVDMLNVVTASPAAAVDAFGAPDDDPDVLGDGQEHLTSTWSGYDLAQSDNESVDSQDEDYLKHAGIYTTEEATVITKKKMQRLQKLYGEQVIRLRQLMRQKRRSCVRNMRIERDASVTASGHSPGSVALASNAATAPLDVASPPGPPGPCPAVAPTSAIVAGLVLPPKIQKQRALSQYLKKHGIEAVLQQKATERRAAALSSAAAPTNTLIGASTGGLLMSSGQAAGQPPTAINRCVFAEGGVTCGERGIPLAKYCRKHILEDRAQVLFKACGIEKSGVVCREPMPITFENATCALHFELPPQREYMQKKCESDGSDADDDDDDDEVLAITAAAVRSGSRPPASTAASVIIPPSTSKPSTTRTSARQSAAAAAASQSTTDAADDPSVEKSADTMSPLRVTPMDMESDTDSKRIV